MSSHPRNAFLAGALLLLAGLAVVFSSIRCASGERQDAAGSRAAQETTGEVGAPVEGTSQTTALRTSVIHEPLYAEGSDGKVHLEYDLVSTSVFPVPVTLSKVEVRDGDGQRLLTLEGDDLEARTQPLGDTAATREVPASGAANTLVDVVVEPDNVPKRLINRITYELPQDAPEILKALLESTTIEWPQLEVPRRAPLVIAPPLSGDGWFNGNGCCDPTPHRSFRMAVDGERLVAPETFAIDWVQVRGNSTFEGDGTKNEDYFAFGAEVRSATDGEVVDVRDGLAEETPNNDPVNVQLPLDVGGNHVLVRARPGVYAFYGHLQPDSIDVRVGDEVETGQPVGKLGNTGNSTQPHLHFQLADSPDVLTSNSLPFVIDRYTLAGSVALDRSTDTNLVVEDTPEYQEKTHPLFPSVADFR